MKNSLHLCLKAWHNLFPVRKLFSTDSDSTFADNDLPDLIISTTLPRVSYWLGKRPESFLTAWDACFKVIKNKKFLKPDTLITFYRKRHAKVTPCFNQENEIVCYSNVAGLLKKLRVSECDPKDLGLFAESSKSSLKCVLHNGNIFRSIPLRHSTSLEEYNEIKFLPDKNFDMNTSGWLEFCLGCKVGIRRYRAFYAYETAAELDPNIG